MLKFFLAVVVAAAAFFTGANAQNTTLVMNTPSNVLQCLPQLLTWGGGSPPYYLSLHTGAAPDTSIFNFPQLNATSLTWIVNYPEGSSLGFTLRDSTGATSQTAAFTVGKSTESGCLSSTSGGSTLRSATSATPPPATTTTPGGSTPTTTAKPSATPTNTAATTTGGSGGGSSSGSGSSSANKVIANSAMVGAIGAAIFALLA